MGTLKLGFCMVKIFVNGRRKSLWWRDLKWVCDVWVKDHNWFSRNIRSGLEGSKMGMFVLGM